MKHKLLFLALIIVSVQNITAQNVRVVLNEALTNEADGVFCCPQMDKTGNKLFFTTPGYKGLYYYDLINPEIDRLTESPGAGYEPAVNNDGTEAVYRTYTLKNGRQYYSIININTLTKEKTVLQKEVRDLSVPRIFADGTIAFALHSALKKNTNFTIQQNKQIPETQTTVFIEDQKIVLFKGDKRRTIEPRGPGSYIWPELSPSGKQLLFKKLGDGCYISDLNGNILSSLGNINAPHWSPDGKHIVYMADTDDGRQITSSEIHIIKADGSHDVQLTGTEDKIELYPRWGNDSNTIIYNTEKGQIYLMRLEWK